MNNLLVTRILPLIIIIMSLALAKVILIENLTEFKTKPWTVRIEGEVETPIDLSMEEIL